MSSKRSSAVKTSPGLEGPKSKGLTEKEEQPAITSEDSGGSICDSIEEFYKPTNGIRHYQFEAPPTEEDKAQETKEKARESFTKEFDAMKTKPQDELYVLKSGLQKKIGKAVDEHWRHLRNGVPSKISEVGRKHGVYGKDLGTLRRVDRGEITVDRVGVPGRPPILPKPALQFLAGIVDKCNQNGAELTAEDFGEKAVELAYALNRHRLVAKLKNTPKADWLVHIRKQHDLDLKGKRPKKANVAAQQKRDLKIAKAFHKLLHDSILAQLESDFAEGKTTMTLDAIKKLRVAPANNIIYWDETQAKVDDACAPVLSSSKNVPIAPHKDNLATKLSLMIGVAASGHVLPAFGIYDSDTTPWAQTDGLSKVRGVKPSHGFTNAPGGSMTKSRINSDGTKTKGSFYWFCRWLVFSSNIRDILEISEDETVFHIWDGHSSHFDRDGLELLSEHRHSTFCGPSHTTSYLQPNDNLVNQTFHEKKRKNFQAVRTEGGKIDAWNIGYESVRAVEQIEDRNVWKSYRNTGWVYYDSATHEYMDFSEEALGLGEENIRDYQKMEEEADEERREMNKRASATTITQQKFLDENKHLTESGGGEVFLPTQKSLKVVSDMRNRGVRTKSQKSPFEIRRLRPKVTNDDLARIQNEDGAGVTNSKKMQEVRKKKEEEVRESRRAVAQRKEERNRKRKEKSHERQLKQTRKQLKKQRLNQLDEALWELHGLQRRQGGRHINNRDLEDYISGEEDMETVLQRIVAIRQEAGKRGRKRKGPERVDDTEKGSKKHNPSS